ncbi:MAG: RHS repeat domain-containing protein [Bergeyella cardium]
MSQKHSHTYNHKPPPDTAQGGFGFIPNGIREKNIFFYHPDHLGSSSYITGNDGKVSQHTEYIAFGEILFDEHNTEHTMPYLFNGKELDQETGLYYYGARYYDPKVSIFVNVDPLVEKTMQPYAYANNNPVMLIDPTGKESEHIDVIKNENGTYTVVGGKANNDKNIYVVDNGGKRTGEVVGQMLTEYSFHDENGNAILGANINLNDKSGKEFFNNEFIEKLPFIADYMKNATGGEKYDFKRNNTAPGEKNYNNPLYHYRGMPFQGKIASARDIGNFAAGYIAGIYGLSWNQARFGFDALETRQIRGIIETIQFYPFNKVSEGQPTQRAERAGYNLGNKIFNQLQFERRWKEATNRWGKSPRY